MASPSHGPSETPPDLLARAGEERRATTAQGAEDTFPGPPTPRQTRLQSQRRVIIIPHPLSTTGWERWSGDDFCAGQSGLLVPLGRGFGPGNTTRRVTEPAWRSRGRLVVVPGGAFGGWAACVRHASTALATTLSLPGAESGESDPAPRMEDGAGPVDLVVKAVMVGTSLRCQFRPGGEIGW